MANWNSRQVENSAGALTYNAPPPGFVDKVLFENDWQNYASSNVDEPILRAGYEFRTWDGKRFVYVYWMDSTAAVEGNITINNGLTQATTISQSTDGLTLTGFSGLLPGQWVGGYAYISAVSAGSADGQCRRIIRNSATVVELERAFTTSLSTNTATIQLFHPYQVKLTGTSNPGRQRVSGVSYGALSIPTGTNMWTAGGVTYGGWLQTEGICEAVLVASAIGGNNGALVAGGTAGKADDVATSSTPDAEAIFAYALQGITFDTSVPAKLVGCVL